MKRGLIVIGLLGYCVIALLGCTTLAGKESGNPGLLEPASALKFSDIPVPAGFKIQSRDSYCFESSGVRAGVLKYKGKADADQVINFYKEQMPMYNWNLLNIVEFGQRLMNFDRENETCVISLLPRGSCVIITISIGPKPQIPKKSNKPIK
jgi:hypothetical protein